MKFNNKQVISIAIIIFIISLIIFGIVKFNTRIIDISNSKHGVTIEENVDFYKKTKLLNVKVHKELPLGTNVYVLEDVEKDGIKWSKVVIDNKIGYILSEKIGYYKSIEDEKVLMADVSKFNKSTNFKTGGEFGAFLINNNITYVYVRAGGRGYGEKGKFYLDAEYKTWADECEFLGVPFGFYFLDEAINSEEIDEEVSFISDFLTDNKYDNMKLPVALDIEKHNGEGRADDIWEERAILVTELVQKLENIDIKCIVYSNANTANEFLGTVPAKFWLAYYPDNITKIPQKWYADLEEQEPTENEELMSKMIGWQFTQTGVGRVIPHSVDISLIYRNFYK